MTIMTTKCVNADKYQGKVRPRCNGGDPCETCLVKYYLNMIGMEYDSSRVHKGFNSAHEGYAVLKEEIDELWDEIKKKDPHHDELEEEAIQVGAMALKFLITVVAKKRKEYNDRKNENN